MWPNIEIPQLLKKDNFKPVKSFLTHWLPHQTVRDPPLISWRSMEYFRASESTKINHMHSNNRHKFRFQDFVYLKFNKWTAKYYRNINKNNSTWCIWLVRIQEIIFFLCHVRNVEKIEYTKTSYFFYFRGQNETEYYRISILLL